MTPYDLSTAFLSRIRLIGAVLLPLALAGAAYSQSTGGTGAIVGRVYDPANHEYVQNAQVDVQGTAISAVTAADGGYRLANVPAGPVTITVTYTGLKAEPASAVVAAGQTLRQDFNLQPAGAAPEEVVKLNAYTVAATATGDAKMIMQQKESMTVSTMVSADSFGSIPEGNVGEFLKFLPGIDLDYVEAEARNPRIRGLPSQFTSVTFDHMRLASADAFIQNNGMDNGGGKGAGDRSFGFDQVSLNNIDAVQVNYTVNAAMDADGAAGNINLVPRHAFERKGQYIMVQAQGMMNSETAYLASKFGPDDARNSSIRPNGQIAYANSWFDNRLGLNVGLSEAQTYEQQRQFAPGYNTATTATDPRPFVLTTLQYKDGPVLDQRPTANATLDFKVNDYLTASLIWQWTGKYHWVGNRTFSIATSRASVGGDGITSWDNVPVTSVGSSMAYLNKRIFSQSWIPSLEFKKDNWDINLVGSVSRSVNNYAGGESDSFPGNSVGGTSIPTTGMTASASHPADDMYAWTIVQNAGADWGKLSSYNAAATAYPTFSEDGRYQKDLVNQVELDAKYTLPLRWPTWVQAGPKVTETTFVYNNSTAWQTWNYMGPGGGLGGNWASFPSQFQFNPGNGAIFRSISGHTPAVQDHNSIGYLFKADPQYFVPAGTAANYYTAFVQQPHYAREQINAYYAMFDTKPTRRLEVQAGLRVEQTIDEVKNIQSVPAAQVAAAGFPVTASTGVATTIPGIQYEYFSLPRAAVGKDYTDLFPSASVKYSFRPDLVALAGYSYTVTRPSFGDISGSTSENTDVTPATISLPNTNLPPEYSNNYSLQLTKYFEPVGDVGLMFFENDFKNFTQNKTLPGSGSAFGFTDPMLADASVTTTVALPGTVTFRGMSIDYRQGLTFLPKPFDGLRIFANYTRIYTRVTGVPAAVLEAPAPYNYGWLPGVSPNVINYGISYSGFWFGISLNAHWTDTTPYSSTYNVWEKNKTELDGSAWVRLSQHATLIFSAHNILDVPDYTYLGTPARVFSSGARGIEYYGGYFYSGVRMTF